MHHQFRLSVSSVMETLIISLVITTPSNLQSNFRNARSLCRSFRRNHRVDRTLRVFKSIIGGRNRSDVGLECAKGRDLLQVSRTIAGYPDFVVCLTFSEFIWYSTSRRCIELTRSRKVTTRQFGRRSSSYSKNQLKRISIFGSGLRSCLYFLEQSPTR